MTDGKKFTQTKAFDLLMGVPLIIWFGYVEGVRLRPALAATARAVLAEPNLLHNLQFFGLFAAVAFNFLAVYLIVMRDSPVKRPRGVLPYLAGFVGTFIGVGIQFLKPVTLPLGLQLVSSTLSCLGFVACCIVLAKLGKSFSIVPEARALLTGGPYSLARHPLYVMEIVAIVGVSLQFQQPWSTLFSLAVIVMLVVRTHFEEQILTEAFPEYVEYRKRVKRFGFV